MPSKPAAINKKNRLAEELTSRNSGTGPKSKWNSPLHYSECFRMTNASVIFVIKKFFSWLRENFPSPEIEDILLPHSLVSGVSYIALGQKQNGGEDFEEIKGEIGSIQNTERFKFCRSFL